MDEKNNSWIRIKLEDLAMWSLPFMVVGLGIATYCNSISVDATEIKPIRISKPYESPLAEPDKDTLREFYK